MNTEIETTGAENIEPRIKPCPFCGHEAWIMNTLEMGANDDPPNCHIYCPQCFAQGPVVAFKPRISDERIMSLIAEGPSDVPDADIQKHIEHMRQVERKAITKWNLRQVAT